jgi:hypothetical protein
MSLVLSMLLPASQGIFLALVLLSPLTGLFYWQKAGRSEQVALKLERVALEGSSTLSLITVRAHRDELAAMQKALSLKTTD